LNKGLLRKPLLVYKILLIWQKANAEFTDDVYEI